MKNTFLTFFLLLTSIAFSQNEFNNKIIGNWKVRRVVHAKSNANTKDFINGLKGSTFIFAKDNTFNVTTTNNSESFKMFTEMVSGKKWLTKPNFIIAIGSKSDNYSIMKIKYKSENEIVSFELYETDIELEVEKI